MVVDAVYGGADYGTRLGSDCCGCICNWRSKFLNFGIKSYWFRRKVDFKHEGVDRVMKLMLPALFRVSVTQINLLPEHHLGFVYASRFSVMVVQCENAWLELPLGLIWGSDRYGDFCLLCRPVMQSKRLVEVPWHDGLGCKGHCSVVGVPAE